MRQEIVTRRMFTPLDFQNVFGTWQGSSFSVAPRLLQGAYFRDPSRRRRAWRDQLGQGHGDDIAGRHGKSEGVVSTTRALALALERKKATKGK
ncbi:MAG TPA: hypothetical protein VIM14_02005 [Polyangia bacterium]